MFVTIQDQLIDLLRKNSKFQKVEKDYEQGLSDPTKNFGCRA
jgi:hypothetical protein